MLEKPTTIRRSSNEVRLLRTIRVLRYVKSEEADNMIDKLLDADPDNCLELIGKATEIMEAYLSDK